MPPPCAGRVACRIEFPSAHRFYRTLFEPKSNAPHQANLRSLAVRPDQHAQRHRALYFDLPRLIGIDRVRTREARWQNPASREEIVPFTIPRVRTAPIAHAAFAPIPDAVFYAWSRRLRIYSHPRQPKRIHARDYIRRLLIQNCGCNCQQMIGIVR